MQVIFQPDYIADAAIHMRQGEIIRYNDAHSDDDKPKGTQMTNKEVIPELYQNFSSGDVPAVIARFNDTIAWTEADGFPLALDSDPISYDSISYAGAVIDI